MKRNLQILAVGAGVACSAQAGSPTVTVTQIALPNLPLGLIGFPSGKAMNLSVSPGAGAFRLRQDPEGRIWSITDRGPSIDCSEEKDIIGAEDKQICAPNRRGKIYPLPGFAPSIYAIDVSADNAARYAQMIPLKGKSGKPLTGIPNRHSNARSENAYALDGRQLDADPSGVEPGGLVRLANGTFWVAEEFAPSILEVAADGAVLRRLAPEGMAADLQQADYPVEASLPAIMSLRQVTRGFDGIAVSPDEAYLYVAMQNALANPDIETYRRSPAIRIWKIERVSGKVVAQFLYAMEPPATFMSDQNIGGRPLRQSDVRVSEIVAIDNDRLLVMERIRSGTKIFKVDLLPNSRIPAKFDDKETRPGLEELTPSEWEGAGLVPLNKVQVLDSDNVKGLGGKLSGMALIDPHQMLLLSNNDSGIDGGRTQMFRLTFPEPVLK